MGNCLGRKASKHRAHGECRLQTLSASLLSNGSTVLVSYPLEELHCTRSLVDNEKFTSDDEHCSMGLPFTREKLIAGRWTSALKLPSILALFFLLSFRLHRFLPFQFLLFDLFSSIELLLLPRSPPALLVHFFPLLRSMPSRPKLQPCHHPLTSNTSLHYRRTSSTTISPSPSTNKYHSDRA